MRFFFLLISRPSWRCCCVKIERKTHKKDHRKRSLMICFVHLSLTISSSLSFTWVLKNWWPILKFWCFFNCSYVKDVKMTIWLLLFGHFPLLFKWDRICVRAFHCAVGWSKIDTFFFDAFVGNDEEEAKVWKFMRKFAINLIWSLIMNLKFHF